MPRPRKKGLAYFPKDVDYYSDYKIMDLLNEYGPLGQTIYDITISLIYKEGYYLAISLDKLAIQIVRIVGNRWISNKNLVLQVIRYCADIGLFHDGLLRQNVITSVGIQKRYAEVTARNKVNKDEYWLLDIEQPLISVVENPENVAETPENVAKTPENVAKTPINKSKENKSKVKGTNVPQKKNDVAEDNKVHIPDEIKEAWDDFVLMRKQIKKPLTERAVEMALKKLEKLAPGNYKIQIEILNQSTFSCWSDLYELKDKRGGNSFGGSEQSFKPSRS